MAQCQNSCDTALLLRLHLQELRIACSLAQQEREGGISAFVSPLAQVSGRLPAVQLADIVPSSRYACNQPHAAPQRTHAACLSVLHVCALRKRSS